MTMMFLTTTYFLLLYHRKSHLMHRRSDLLVLLFGGIDPLAGRTQLGGGKKDGGAKTRETGKKSRERSDLFGKNPVNEFRCYEAKIVYFQPEARCSEHSGPLVRSQFLFYYVMVEVINGDKFSKEGLT